MSYPVTFYFFYSISLLLRDHLADAEHTGGCYLS
jgi:hypothetical protein